MYVKHLRFGRRNDESSFETHFSICHFDIFPVTPTVFQHVVKDGWYYFAVSMCLLTLLILFCCFLAWNKLWVGEGYAHFSFPLIYLTWFVVILTIFQVRNWFTIHLKHVIIFVKCVDNGFCDFELTRAILNVYYNWPETVAGIEVSLPCAFVAGKIARRNCTVETSESLWWVW